MFNKSFFESEFPKLTSNYAKDNRCGSPIVEFQLTNDDAFLVHSINQVSDNAIVLNCYRDNNIMTQTVCPIDNISKINLYKELPDCYNYDKKKEYGFKAEVQL